jgi:general secretion pathway protein G
MSIVRQQPTVFFPWERRRGLRSVFRGGRARKVLCLVLGAVLLAILWHRENRASEVRATRATITGAYGAVANWRADHDRGCPASLADLVSGGYLAELPRDAWGRVLRMTCPGRKDPRGFDISSDGPDGEPAGLDRVE